MFIMLVLLVLALALILGGICVSLLGIASGTILLWAGKARLVALTALFVLPFGSIGCVTGAFLLGRYLISVNETLLFYGPLIGLIVGGMVGTIVGGAFAGVAWVLIKRRARRRYSNTALQRTRHSPTDINRPTEL